MIEKIIECLFVGIMCSICYRLGFKRKARNDVQSVKCGHWIDMGDHEQCSECKATRLKEFQSYYGKVTRWEKSNFCPACGIDMRGDDNDD